MEFPDELRYTTHDEWILVEDDEAMIGITDYAQDRLGDVVFVELPESGRRFQQGDSFGIVESVKAVCDLYMPVGGEIIATNAALEDAPEVVNGAPYTDGWMIRIRIDEPAQIETLLTADAYREQLPDGAAG